MLLHLWQLAVGMAKAGLLSWGGGMALIPFMHKDFVVRYELISQAHFEELASVNAALPGVFAVKLAAMIGWEVAGLAGLVVSIAALTLPNVLLFIGLFAIVKNNMDRRWVASLTRGLSFGAAGLIAYATLTVLPRELMQSAPRSFVLGLALSCLVFAVLKFGLSPALAMVLSGIAGLALAL